MKQTDGYILQEIDGIPYLLPYGQLIADHRRGVQLNETGVFLWNTLKHVHNREDLLKCLLEHYQAATEDIPAVAQDLEIFLKQLSDLGLIDMELSSSFPQPPACKCLKIGGIYLKLTGRAEAFSSCFDPFAVEDCGHTDLTVEVCTGIPQTHENGILLLRSSELLICDRGEDYLLMFPKSRQISEASFDKSGSYARFYCMPPFTDSLTTELFHAIRFVYLYLAQRRGLFALHSASILYRDRAWLFSGHSGMGKSTHTNLWNELFCTPIINGDLNLMELTEDGAVIHGMPWCGTSGIADPGTYPLGGIILLKRALNDECLALSEDKKVLLVMQRLISPAWTEDMLALNLDFTERLKKNVHVCQLHCTKNPSAAHTMKAWIDQI